MERPAWSADVPAVAGRTSTTCPDFAESALVVPMVVNGVTGPTNSAALGRAACAALHDGFVFFCFSPFRNDIFYSLFMSTETGGERG